METQGFEAAYLKVTEIEGGLCLLWRDARGERRIPCAISAAQLPELRRWVSKEIQGVKNLLGKALRPRSVGTTSRALDRLETAGLFLAERIFGDELPLMWKLFRDIHPTWNNSDREIPIVTVVASIENTLPLELLPIFGPRRIERLDLARPYRQPEFDDCLRRFLGFSVILKRVIATEGEPRSGEFRNDPKLPMKVFVQSTLPGVRKEITFFTKTAMPWIDAQIWPEQRLGGTVSDLVRNVWHCARTSDSKLTDQIHHFACHCSTEHEDSPNHYLTLGRSKGKAFRASISEMLANRATLDRADLPAADSRPFVFLNACSSSYVDPIGATSFPDLFLRRFHCRGFIGSETTVSDAVAAEFSRMFYTYLLSGAPLGEACHNARWWLAHEFCNPLGLFYSCYADPEMSVVKRVNF